MVPFSCARTLVVSVTSRQPLSGLHRIHVGMALDVGSVVTLASGGHLMTIAKIDQEKGLALCVWATSALPDRILSEELPLATLVPATHGRPRPEQAKAEQHLARQE